MAGDRDEVDATDPSVRADGPADDAVVDDAVDDEPDVDRTDDPVAGSDSPVASPPRRRPATWWATVAVAVLSIGMLGAMWTVASPIGAGPDDDFHLASIWCSPTAPDHLCNDLGFSYAAGQTFVDVPAEVGPTGLFCYAGIPANSAQCLAIIEHQTFDRTLANDGLYPGGYYTLLGLTVGDQPARSALFARYTAWVLSAGLLAAGWAVLPRLRRPEYLAVLLVAMVPHGIYFFASTNPSGLVVAGVASAWAAAVAVLTTEERRRLVLAATLLGVATLAAVGSRSDAGIYLFVSLVSACVLLWRPDRELVRRVAGVAGAAGIGLAVSFVVLSRRLDASGDGLFSGDSTAGETGANLWRNIVDLPWYATGNLGVAGLGWLDTPMPQAVWASVVVAFAGLLFWGLARVDLAKGLALVCALSGLLVVPFLFLWRGGHTLPEEIQPRYVLPMLAVVGFTAVHWRGASSVGRLGTVQLATILALVTVAHSVALHFTIRRYVTGTDVTALDLDAGREWWWDDLPLTPNGVWVLGSVAFAALVVVAGRQIHHAPDGELAPVVADTPPEAGDHQREQTGERLG